MADRPPSRFFPVYYDWIFVCDCVCVRVKRVNNNGTVEELKKRETKI